MRWKPGNREGAKDCGPRVLGGVVKDIGCVREAGEGEGGGAEVVVFISHLLQCVPWDLNCLQLLRKLMCVCAEENVRTILPYIEKPMTPRYVK